MRATLPLLTIVPEMNDPTLKLFDQLAEKEQQKLEAVFFSRHATISSCCDVMRKTTIVLRQRGWHTHSTLWNAVLFLNTVSYDLSTVTFDLGYERDNWKRRYIARNAAMLLFEVGEDLPSLFGKGFREAAAVLGVAPSQVDLVGAETKKISALWNQNRTLLKEIRTIATAHRDHNAIALHDTIDTIDLFALMGLSLEFGALMNSLGAATQPILKFTASVAPPEKLRGMTS